MEVAGDQSARYFELLMASGLGGVKAGKTPANNHDPVAHTLMLFDEFE